MLVLIPAESSSVIFTVIPYVLKLALYHLRNCLSLCFTLQKYQVSRRHSDMPLPDTPLPYPDCIRNHRNHSSHTHPSPRRKSLFSVSLCCYSDNAVNVNSVCHCFSEIFIVCRRFFRIERKISKGSLIIADQIQIRINLRAVPSSIVAGSAQISTSPFCSAINLAEFSGI